MPKKVVPIVVGALVMVEEDRWGWCSGCIDFCKCHNWYWVTSPEDEKTKGVYVHLQCGNAMSRTGPRETGPIRDIKVGFLKYGQHFLAIFGTAENDVWNLARKTGIIPDINMRCLEQGWVFITIFRTSTWPRTGHQEGQARVPDPNFRILLIILALYCSNVYRP